MSRQAALEVAGEASDDEHSARLAREVTPDVVLMDIPMPDTDGLAATRQIAADGQLASVRVVILTTFELDEYVFEAIRSGASGFLVKDSEPEERVQAVRVVAGGDALTSVSGVRDPWHVECGSDSHQVGEGIDSHLPHNPAPVGLHRDLADTEPGRDLLVQQAGDDQCHGLSFARRE